MSIKNVLIIKLSAIGDVIHALPVSYAIKETYPDAHITWVVEPPAYDLLSNNPYIDEINLSRKKEFKSWKGFCKNFPDFSAKLREKKYDVVLDLQGLAKSGILAFLARGEKKIGTCDMREMSQYISKPTVGANANGHIVERYLDVARAIGCRVENVVFPIYPTKEEEERAHYLIREEGRLRGDYVAIAVGTNWPNKCWPVANIARLADLLYILGMKPVLVGGGKEEEKIAKEVHKKMRSTALSLVGKTCLKELAAVIRGARAFVGGDTGPTHLAAGLGIPTVEIMGPTDANRNGPYGQQENAIEIEAECKHCWKRKCAKNIVCLEDITPQQVLDKLNPYID